jgi:Integral membrane protein DUF92
MSVFGNLQVWATKNMPSLNLHLLSLAFTSLLSLHAYRKRSLSSWGICVAFCVGFLIFACPLRAYGISLLVFYLLGSRVTKCEQKSRCKNTTECLHIYLLQDGKHIKAQREEGYQESGNRTGWQVFCNSFAGLVACILWTALFVPDSFLSLVVGEEHRALRYDPSAWCPLSPDIFKGWSRALLFASLGFRILPFFSFVFLWSDDLCLPADTLLAVSGTHSLQSSVFSPIPLRS